MKVYISADIEGISGIVSWSQCGRPNSCLLYTSSYEEHELMLADAEQVLQDLGLHYRVVLLCAGDMGEKGCKCYDLEVWSCLLYTSRCV